MEVNEKYKDKTIDIVKGIAIFLVVLGHLWAGAWGWASLGIFLVMAPGVMLGLVVGDWLHKHIPLERFRLLVQAGLALVGLWLGIRG
ncbi:MAG: hypothetical protein N2515_00995 [Deltaproteobacteria bacterium]|nr:hypothetical protein [Deltaproteobacteria bacterium]